jgi:hypothetical protein
MSNFAKFEVMWEKQNDECLYGSGDLDFEKNEKVDIRFITLPREFRTEELVKLLVEERLYLGKANAVNLTSHISSTGVKFYSAVVSMERWNNTTNTINLFEKYYSKDDSPRQIRVDIKVSHLCSFPMSWDNGKEMNHLTVQLINNTMQEKAELELKPDEWTSLHIPILPNGLSVELKSGWFEYVNENTLKRFIEERLRVGKVKRIDFVERDDLTFSPPVKAAFIHFDSWNDNKGARFLRDKLNTEGNFRQKGFFDGTTLRKFMVQQSSGEPQDAFFVFKINHRPIPDADTCGLNIHQLLAIKTKLEGTIENMSKEIEELKKQLEEKGTSTPEETKTESTI